MKLLNELNSNTERECWVATHVYTRIHHIHACMPSSLLCRMTLTRSRKNSYYTYISAAFSAGARGAREPCGGRWASECAGHPDAGGPGLRGGGGGEGTEGTAQLCLHVRLLCARVKGSAR